MTKTPVNLQDLRRRIYRKAKSEKEHRFWGIFVHVTKIEVLAEAYRQAKRNDGAPGIDGETFEDVDSAGVAAFLQSIRDDLLLQELTNRERTVSRRYPKGTARPAPFKSLASATAWYRGH